MIRRSPGRWGWFVMAVVLAIVAYGLFGGCVAASPTVNQTAQRDAVFKQMVAGIERIEAKVDLTVTATAALVSNQSDQEQRGFINIASTGGSLGGYLLATVLALVVWKLWSKKKRVECSLKHTARAIEQVSNGDEQSRQLAAGLKTAIAKLEANRFGEMGPIARREAQPTKG